MSTDWRWEFDPDQAHVAGGIPEHVVAALVAPRDPLIVIVRIVPPLDDL
ncbi:hypothetical protein [Streptomyces synnematoformans]|uniref:Uncharacterized protein n=1 Tax=Streptomyces synnematoformans TaxID=415721 RepID=A0ABP5JL71_9ACTN